jgi:cation transport ATPase
MAACCAYGALVVALFLRKFELMSFSRLSDYDPDADVGTSVNEHLGFDKIKEYQVEGMTCASCVAGIESNLLRRKGVKRVNASFLLNRAVAWYNRLQVTPEVIRGDIEATGFSASFIEIDNGKKKGFVCNWGEAFSWSLLFTIPILLLHAIPGQLGSPRQRQFYALILAGFVQFGFGLPFYRTALLALSSNGLRHLPMDFAIAWSRSVAYAVSVYCYATHIGESYAATTASLITVISLGKHLETRSRTSVTAALSAFAEIVPSTALLHRSKERIPTSRLRTGDAGVAPGERFPCDGTLIRDKGCAVSIELDQGYHTGEIRPVPKEPADVCLAGTTNSSSKPAVVEVVNDGKSRLGAVINAVLAAQSSKSDMQLTTERMASYIVPAAVLLSILSFILWLPIGIFQAVRYTTATIVVYGCDDRLG